MYTESSPTRDMRDCIAHRLQISLLASITLSGDMSLRRLL